MAKASDPAKVMANGVEPRAARGGPWEPEEDGLIGARLRGRFKVVSRRAVGGLSAVYLGVDERRREPVAIKVLHAAYAGMAAIGQRFAREAELSMRLGRRIGAAGRATGLFAGRPFLVLDYLEGETIRERLAARGAAPIAEAVATVDRLLARLQLVHAEGFAHHDLKPANVVARSGALLDLGSAARLGGRSEAAGDPWFASPAYAAPEQLAEGALIDARADLHSAGVILFEMIAGRRPRAIDPALPLLHHDSIEPPSLRETAAISAPHQVVTPELDRLVSRAMARDPAARFSSAQAMRAALARHSSPLIPKEER